MDSRNALKLLLSELNEFEGEVDTSDPEWTQIIFNKHVSSLINKGVIRTKKIPRKVRLAEIIELIFDSEEPSEMLEKAGEFDEILRTYGEGPGKEEMKQAVLALHEVIELLKAATAKP